MAVILTPPTYPRTGWWRLGVLLVTIALVLTGLAVGSSVPSGAAPATNAGEVRILSSAPATFDPAAGGDIVSASVTAQLFEGLTAFDPSLILRPALARSWDVADGGRRLVFHLRSGLVFSDGSPLTGADVVRSWLRLIAPAQPSPLASLMSDVVGRRRLPGRQEWEHLVGRGQRGRPGRHG